MNPQQLETVAEDTACRPCGYNLRGLSPWGKCPECGGYVQDTLRAIRSEANRGPDLRKVDPKSVSEWIEGLWCSLISFAVSAAGWFDVPYATRHSENRMILLGVFVSAWTVGCLGIWKIGRPPGAYTLGRPSISSGRTLRLLILTYSVLPLIWGAVTNWIPENPTMYLILPSAFAALLTGPVLYFRLAKIAEMLPATIMRGFLFIPMALVPLFFCASSVTDQGNDRSSLGLMLALPSPAYLTAQWMPGLAQASNFPWLYLISIVFAMEPVLLLVLLVKLTRARNRLRENTAADVAQISSDQNAGVVI